MTAIWHYDSPLGGITLAGESDALTGLYSQAEPSRDAFPTYCLAGTPCHRVIGAGGALTGYAGGLELKEKLLRLEQLRHL